MSVSLLRFRAPLHELHTFSLEDEERTGFCPFSKNRAFRNQEIDTIYKVASYYVESAEVANQEVLIVLNGLGNLFAANREESN
jgi:hypothetical protein